MDFIRRKIVGDSTVIAASLLKYNAPLTGNYSLFVLCGNSEVRILYFGIIRKYKIVTHIPGRIHLWPRIPANHDITSAYTIQNQFVAGIDDANTYERN